MWAARTVLRPLLSTLLGWEGSIPGNIAESNAEMQEEELKEGPPLSRPDEDP